MLGRRIGGWLVAALLAPSIAVGQVVVHGSGGQQMRGERIEPAGDDGYTFEIYRGMKQRIPKAAVALIEEPPALPGGPPRAAPREPRQRLTDADRAELEGLLKAYFAAAADPAEQARIRGALRERDTLPADEVAAFTRRIRALAMQGPKLAAGTGKFDHPRFPGVVHVQVHAGKAEAGGKLPVFLALHGGGDQSGDWNSGTGMFFGPARAGLGGCVLIAPSVLEQRYAEWGRNPAEEEYVKEILKAAKRTWDIDTDRVYIGGHSMGGYGTWHIGGHQADVFAGLVAAAGGILTGQSVGEAWGWGVIGNLMHTPVTFIHGTKDGPSPVWSDQQANRILDELEKRHPGCYVHRYVEIPDGDHGAPVGGVKAGVEWVIERRRDPAPKAVAWEPTRPFVKHFHWLRVERPAMFQRLEARIDGNTIEVATRRLPDGFSLLLNDRLVDLGRPVTVNVDGAQAFHGLVQPSISAILDSIDDKLDERMVYTARIDF
ncbi:hypothetical protein LBMAG47_13040 [Planctomycetia bacterium]|nr:hypothetical protein LBMAG47_13040 [Planctomycetia bacterium]